MRNPLSRVFGGSFDPKPLKDLPLDPEVGAQMVHFDPFEIPADYQGLPLPTLHSKYPLIKPKDAKDPPPFDPMWRAIIDSLWKRAEPTAGQARGPVLMGAARGDTPGGLDQIRGQTYKPAINPLDQPESASPDDWKHMDAIKRTDAITLRGDTRSPRVVLGREGGFYPPISRTDDYYMTTIFSFFYRYMEKRYGRTILRKDWDTALNSAASSPDDKRLLADYMAWRKVVEGEAFHLGRMTTDEALKGYISTSKSFYYAHYFATNRAPQGDLSWVYITRVRGGFVVPPDGEKWGKAEQEVAQWGPIPAHDILGFCRVEDTPAHKGAVGPIWIRSTFRKSDPRAYKLMFKMLCNWIPGPGDY